MACTHSIGYFSLVSCLLIVLLQSRTGNLAPTQHLKIGVQGKTPTLIVTSAEIGITSNIEAATSAKENTKEATKLTKTTTTTTTATPALSSTATTATKWLHKTNQLKMKGKSLKSLFEKKRDKSTKEKATIWQDKNLMTSTVPTGMPLDAARLAKSLQTAAKPLKGTKDSNLITTTQPEELPEIEASKNNGFKEETKHTASLTTSPAASPTTAQVTTNMKKKQTEAMKNISTTTASTITPGKLPPRISSTESSSIAKIMATMTITKAQPQTTTTTTPTIILTTTIPPLTRDTIDDASLGIVKVLPEALLEKSDSKMKTTSTFAVELTPSVTPVITTEVNVAKGVESSAAETTSTATGTTEFSEVADFSSVTYSNTVANHEPIMTSAKPSSVMNTSPFTEGTVLTTLAYATTDSNDSNITTISSIDAHNTERADEPTQHAVIKLIDLEKHEPISIDELRTKGRSQLSDGGHDGVKQTKKKQLLDKHFMVDTTTDFDFDTIVETSTLLPALPVKLTKNNNSASVDGAPRQLSIEKPPTLMPTHNGYLGPIRMEEHTVSVMHSSENKPKAHVHEASIESKLHDGRIVEIIAPTALLEHELTTSSKAMTQSVITATIKPSIHLRQQEKATVLSTTVFQVPDTTRKPLSVKSNTTLEERRESKISDIQIEVFDSIAAPRKYQYNDEIKGTVAELGTTRPPLLLPTTQERFTQYVVDRTETSTPDTNVDGNSNFHGIGKPEPAAIEIHINVSEGMPNQSEDLEFSYRQSENADDFKSSYDNPQSSSLTSKPLISLPSLQNESYNEHNDDILVVEIIDTSDNSSEAQSTNSDSIKPVFTFRADASTDIELKDTNNAQMADELFMADMKQNRKKAYIQPPILPPPPPPRAPTVDRDSDTIFYISNTEVKVGESPSSLITDENNHGNRQEQLRRTRLENQFFPANYMASTHPNTASGQQSRQKHRYEEDIILSPIRNTADSLKIFRSQGDGAPPLDITYVGESVIEVEQSSGAGAGAGTVTTTASATYATMTPPQSPSPSPLPTQTPDVIIQPAILPEMSIGVPVIGELPPQIELKEIDFMPNEANQQRSGVYETENNDIEENLSDGNNDVDRLVESSIQYGGDLIDEGADGGGGFDGVEGSYPFGNMATMRRRTKNNGAADYAHFTVHHGVNNLRKDELNVDFANARELTLGGISNNENSTTLQSGNETSASMNITYVVAKSTGVNVKVFTAGKQTEEVLHLRTHDFGSFELLFIAGILMLLTLVTLMAFYVSCTIYKRVHGNPQESESSELHLPNGTVARCEVGEGESKADESSTRPPTPTKDEDSSEHDSTNDRNCLPVLDDSNSKKPSNNSNSLNIVNEKHITDSFVNKRSTNTSTARKKEQEEANGQSENSVNSVPDSYAGPNGSVTKMTLKNNHLIVETEERNDISRDARETKMHYTSDKDGVFVVEVARGADSKIIPESPIAELTDDRLFVPQPKLNGNNNKSPTRKYEDEPAVLNNHEQVQIHQPPTELHTSNTERSLHQIEEVEEESMVSPKAETVVEMNLEKNANTGLSQSDLSSTSSADSNKRYNYGNQVLYTVDQKDYASSSPVNINATPKRPAPSETPDNDPKSENGHNSNQTPEKSNGNEAQCEQQNAANTENEVKSEEIVENKMSQEVQQPQTEEKEETLQKQQPDAKQAEIKEEVVEVALDMEVQQLVTETTDAQIELKQKDNATKGTEICTETVKNEIAQEDAKEESMSVSEVEYAVESVTSETDTTQILLQSKTLNTNDIQLDNQVEYESLAQAEIEIETDPEFAYDSLMSLPDPPSNEEMTQFSDFNGIEMSQLDSLPPPPPALLADENTNMPDIVAEIKSKPCQMQSVNGNIEYDCYTGHGNQNGHSKASDQNKAPPPLLEEINSNSKILPNSPLTPPESPPPSPPAQYSNGVIGMNEQFCVAVDVNGS